MFNLETEFVSLESTRALAAATYLHNLAGAPNPYPGWKSASGSFSFPNGNPAPNSPTVVRLDTDPTIDLNQALIVWDCEFEDQPAFGRTFTLKPRTTIGETLVEAEAVLPDGRRVFGRQYVNFYDPNPNGPGDSQNDGATVALYHFSEIPTASQLYPSATDSGSHGYDMQPSGLATRSPNVAWMGNPSGFSAKFAGAGDRLQTASIADSVLRLNGKWTIEARICVKAYVLNASPTIFTLSQYINGANDNANWTLYFNTSTFPQLYGPRSQILVDAAHWGTYVTPNTWHSLKITVDNNGTTTKVYIDNQEVSGSPFSTNPTIVAGSNWTFSMGDFIGDIDELRISNTIR